MVEVTVFFLVYTVMVYLIISDIFDSMKYVLSFYTLLDLMLIFI